MARIGYEICQYTVLVEVNMAYWGFLEVGTRHRYAVSSLMDTSYRLSEQYLEISLIKLQNAIGKKHGINDAIKVTLFDVITSSIMESEFLAFAVAGKKAECAATLAKAYSQMYNGKSRHLGVSHNMIRELLINGVVSIEFVRRWRKKVHFLLSSMSVVYVLTTPIHEDGENATMEQIKKRVKWDNDDYDKYMAEYTSSKKFLVSSFTNYKMTNSRPIMEQYNELLGILGRFTQHKMNMDEAIQVSCIIDKLPSSWKDFKHTLKHQKEELTLVELGSHLCIEESLKVQDNDKPNGNSVVGPSLVNIIEHNNSFRLDIVNDNIGSDFMSTSKLNDSILWHARLAHDEVLDIFKVLKTEVELQQGSLIKRLRIDRGGLSQGF
ncbi:hypothetical protein Tco_0379242 [Tanacetum coccineum]